MKIKLIMERIRIMKKKILIAAAAAVICTATAVLAGNIISIGGKVTEESSLKAEKLITVEEQIEAADFDALAEYVGYDTYEKFELLHRLLVFMGRYCTTEAEYVAVRDMVLDGCDVKTVMDIYQFYQTTNEDVSLVRDIYDLVWEGEAITNRDAVFENAFNYLTDNKCGVLNRDEIEEYLEKGLSIDDIQQANVLSRKGVMTINEILDKLERGTSWESIVEKISGEKISSKYKNAESSILIDAMYTAEITDMTINEAIEAEETDCFYEATQSVNAAMKKKGYWKAERTENTDKIIAEAAEKGIAEETVMELLDSGYSECDMINAINAINAADCNEQTIVSIIAEEAE